ncbi:MAG: hypothetical protein V1775_10145 [Bacteroidota bacterium]
MPEKTTNTMQSRRKCVKKFYTSIKHFFRTLISLETGTAKAGLLSESFIKEKALPVTLSSLLTLQAIYLDHYEKGADLFILPFFFELP